MVNLPCADKWSLLILRDMGDAAYDTTTPPQVCSRQDLAAVTAAWGIAGSWYPARDGHRTPGEHARSIGVGPRDEPGCPTGSYRHPRRACRFPTGGRDRARTCDLVVVSDPAHTAMPTCGSPARWAPEAAKLCAVIQPLGAIRAAGLPAGQVRPCWYWATLRPALSSATTRTTCQVHGGSSCSGCR